MSPGQATLVGSYRVGVALIGERRFHRVGPVYFQQSELGAARSGQQRRQALRRAERSLVDPPPILFHRGDGQLTVADASGNDTLKISGYTTADLVLSRPSADRNDVV